MTWGLLLIVCTPVFGWYLSKLSYFHTPNPDACRGQGGYIDNLGERRMTVMMEERAVKGPGDIFTDILFDYYCVAFCCVVDKRGGDCGDKSNV